VAGAEVTTFVSGNNFLEAVDREALASFDVVVVDYLMPGLNGLETISLLKGKLRPGCAVCLLSGEVEMISDLTDMKLEVRFISKTAAACSEIWEASNKASNPVIADELLQKALMSGVPAFSYGLFWSWNQATEVAFQADQISRSCAQIVLRRPVH
jgi:CheY-like chemotaxis protein